MNPAAPTPHPPPDAQRRVHGHALAVLAIALAAAGICGTGHAAERAAGDVSRAGQGRAAGASVQPVPKLGSRSWSNRNFVYRAEGKRLTDVLQDFAASQGVPAVVADGLEGIVNANFDVKPEAFLESIARAYNMLWYHDGTALYFYPGRAVQGRMFRLKGFRREQVQDLLRSLDLGDKRYPIKYDQAQSTLFVSGPPRHVELVSSALDALDAGVAEGAGRTVRVFALRFASAGDRAMGETSVPGVASTLHKLYAHGSDSGSATSTATNAIKEKSGNKMTALPKLGPGQYLPTLPRNDTDDRAKSNQRPLAGPADADDTPPHFEADEGSNSVIVHGRADRMADYEALIRRLDQKPLLVELEATIIEVNSDSVEALGVNWSIRNGRGSVSMSAPQTNGVLAEASSFTLGTVVTNAGRELLARVNALQGEGKARILSKPSVLGVANRTAVMREKRVATVRVSGNLEANLFQVEAGTLLEMTPQVTHTDGTNSIKLSLYIEDGNFEAASVDQIPIVKRTEIRTEAHVLEGESLLIGGITVESEQTQRNGVPGLSRVPVLGGIFRNRAHQTQRTERLFLITPRLLDSGANTRRNTDAAITTPNTSWAPLAQPGAATPTSPSPATAY